MQNAFLTKAGGILNAQGEDHFADSRCFLRKNSPPQVVAGSTWLATSFFPAETSRRIALFRCSSFPQAIPPAAAARLQAPSQRLRSAANRLRCAPFARCSFPALPRASDRSQRRLCFGKKPAGFRKASPLTLFAAARLRAAGGTARRAASFAASVPYPAARVSARAAEAEAAGAERERKRSDGRQADR